jgi:predicted ArsR family transcriptional regulator
MAEPRTGAPSADRSSSPTGHVDHTPSATLRGVSGLRRDILLRLRHDGPSSPDQLAARLGASRTGVLQQLRALETARLVRHETQRHGVGRPRHLYDVTEDAQELFPANYDGLAAGLLEAIGAIGGDDLVEQVFAARRRQIGDRVRRELADRVGPQATLADRVRELAVIQDEQGYLCEAERLGDGRFRLREHNCAIYDVARGRRAACDAELDLFREVLGVVVERETHIASGDRACTYLIRE